MVKSKFSLFIDSTGLSLSLSFLIYIWLRPIIKNAYVANIFLIFITITSFIVIFYLFCKTNNKKILKSSNEKFITSCLNHIIICPFEEYKLYICKLLNCTHIDKFMFKVNNNLVYINLKTELTENDYFSAQDIFLQTKNVNQKLYFIFRSKSKLFDNICNLSPINISFFDSLTFIKVMIKKNIFPISKSNKKEKIHLKQRIIKIIKCKTQGIKNNHFKEIFFSGISLLFLSLIVPFSKYYLIIGSILILISIITLFKKNYKKEPSDSDILFN